MDAVNALPAGFVYVEPTGEVTVTNRRYQDMLSQLGVSPDKAHDVQALIRPSIRTGPAPQAAGPDDDRIDEQLSVPAPLGDGLEYQMPDGRWYKAYDRPTGDGGIVGIRVDVTTFKEQQDVLKAAIAERDAAKQRFLDIADVSSDWFWEQDRDLRFTFISKSFERSIGSSSKTRIGMTRREIIGGEKRILESSDWDWLDSQTDARKPFRDFVYGAFDRPDNPTWVQISGAPFFDEDGAFAGYRGVGSDVTALYKAMIDAEEANRAKSDFLANMSHEIRTPLSAVLGMAQELERRIVEPEQHRFVETIRQSGEHLLEVINDVLDFSKIEAGKLELERAAFDPSDLMEKITSLHTMKAEEKGLRLSVQIERSTGKARLGDAQRILQILHNLVGNAIKFTNRGSVSVTLDDVEGGPLSIRVVDTGIGMTTEPASRIFDGFSQGDTSIARRFGGTGLGMSITKRLVDAMHGTIEIKSVSEAGTTVMVRLPLDRPVAMPALPEPTVSKVALPPGIRILAVDDNATNRILIGLLLGQIKADATIVSDGKTAIEMTARKRFDIILMDIAMPDIDGIETLRSIRRRDAPLGQEPVPALAVTANALKHQIDDYLANGFDGHVAKPIQIGHLFTEIARLHLRQRIPMDHG